MRWQDPLPQPDPPADWEHATWRFNPDGYRDRPFILRDGEHINGLSADEQLDLERLVDRYRAMRRAVVKSREWMTFDPLEGLVVERLADVAREEVEALRSRNESLQHTPRVSEIGAIDYYPLNGRAVLYVVAKNASTVPRNATTGEVLLGRAPEAIDPWGGFVVALGWWRRERGEWVQYDNKFVPGNSDLLNYFVPDLHDILEPYNQLWLEALRSEAAKAAQKPQDASQAVTPTATPTPTATSPDCAPWVYCHPSRWDAITEWRESMRWQDPLPQSAPPADWEHATWRFSPDGYHDRPFILRDDERVDGLRAVEQRDIERLFARHQALLRAWAESLELMSIEPLTRAARLDSDGTLWQDSTDREREAQREWNESSQTSPYVHEIIAIAYYPTKGEAEILSLYRDLAIVSRDFTTGDPLRIPLPEETTPTGTIIVVRDHWRRGADGEWLQLYRGSSVEIDPPSYRLFVGNDVFAPYQELWLAALRAEAGE